MFKNKQGRVIYIGKAKDLKSRVSQYFRPNRLDSKTIRMVGEVNTLETIRVNSEIEAFLLEANLIKKYKPFFNVKLSDDKFFPYIVIGKDKKLQIPYVSITRKKDNKGVYFGPYVNVTDVKAVLKTLRKIFPFQSVINHQKKKCLYYHLGLCPCIPANPQNLDEYKKNIERLKNFLNGKTSSVVRGLKSAQKIHIKKEEFEEAAQIQKKIERIEFITSEIYSPFSYMEKPDSYYKRIEDELSSLVYILNANGLKISSLEKIECFDISNIQGKQATGSMVVFSKGDADKSQYRRFKINGKSTPDDFAMHKEMMKRRLKNTQWKYPDLMVIDGGKGQTSSVMSVLKESGHNIPLIGLAKRFETIVIPYPTYNNRYDFLEVKLPEDTPGVNLLKRLRDEAHRFAVAYHRKLRQKLIK